jgi:hypothetical protein
VYVVAVEASTAAVTSLVPLVRYAGSDWPTAAMKDGGRPFEVTTRVFLRSEQPVTGKLIVAGSWGASAALQVSLSGGDRETQINTTLEAESPRLWWARGMGAQTMYNVSAFFQTGSGPTARNVSVTRRIGAATKTNHFDAF